MMIDPRIPKSVELIIKNYLLLTKNRLLGLINTWYGGDRVEFYPHVHDGVFHPFHTNDRKRPFTMAHHR